MFDAVEILPLVRNLVLYSVGLALSIAGALGVADAIELNWILAAVMFVIGLTLVVFVHERFDGPF